MRSRETLLRLHRFRTEEKRRQVADIDGMIQDFMRKFDDLDAQVKFEEGRTGVSDPAHFNYSMTAKAARSRRDNLMKSIAELRDQLADAQTALGEEEQELRRAELLVEKESGSSHSMSPGATVAGAMQIRPA
jgi:flagellar export protein FliJ